ncbi:anticodon-binding aminoacyl-tRNA synthetase, class 1a [Tanacetum coccineum]
MDANENSHEITIRIHEVQYSTVVAKLRKVFRNTDRMKFIKGLQSQKDYFILTLETRDEYAVSLYVRKEDLYVIAVAVRGGQIYEFRGYKEFARSKSLPYGEGYSDLSTRVDFDNFTLAEELQESTLKNDDERELGLHLLGFSEVLEEVCTLLTPHILCQYVYELCVKFDSLETSAGQDVMSSEETSNLLLCEATEVVMRKCFYLLGITPICKT